jgi:segregation and condensation protein A
MNTARRTNDKGAAPLEDLWDAAEERSLSDPALVIDVDGFEGPLDLLLHLARNQKVDLARISVLKLAEQYLLFINNAVALRLELAADYLVMAAWLAFLKSKLLIPKTASEDGEASGSYARGCRPARQPQPAWPRRIPARRSGDGHHRQAE